MIKKLIPLLKYVLSLGLAAVLLYFVFRNVDFADFMERAKRVEYSWVIYSIILSVFSFIARAYRWNLLMTPMGYSNLSTFRTTLAVVVGYLANLAFPRLGEVTRCALMKRTNAVPIPVSIGTVISERVIDLISLIVLLILAFILEADVLIRFLSELMSTYVQKDTLIILILVGVVGLLIMAAVLWIILRKAGPRLKEFIRQLIEGLISIKKVKSPTAFILSTVVLWTTYYFMSYLIVFSLPDTSQLSWGVGIMLLVTGGIALAIPVQGGFGTYHTLISVMLALYGIDHVTGVFLATLLHTSQVVATALFGAIALLVTVFLKKKNGAHPEDQKLD